MTGSRLPESIFIQTVTGDYPEGDVIDPVIRDVRLRPDPSTMRLVPWYEEPTAQVIGDAFHHDGSPVPDRLPAGAAPGAGALRGAGLAAGGGARARVLPDQDQQRSGLSAGAADRPLEAAGDRPPGLRHRGGQRVRSRVRGRLRLVRGAGDRHRHAGARGGCGADGDQLQPRRSAASSPTRRSCSSGRCGRRR